MTSSIHQYALITHDVIEVGVPKTCNLKSSCKDANFGIFFKRIGSETKKLWPRVLYMTTSLFPSITQISKIDVNHNVWLILIILDENESWWPEFYEKKLHTYRGSMTRTKRKKLWTKWNKALKTSKLKISKNEKKSFSHSHKERKVRFLGRKLWSVAG